MKDHPENQLEKQQELAFNKMALYFVIALVLLSIIGYASLAQQSLWYFLVQRFC